MRLVASLAYPSCLRWSWLPRLSSFSTIKNVDGRDEPGHDVPRKLVTCLLHRALIVEFVLVVLDDQRHGVKRVAAVGAFLRVLQIEILNRDVIVAELEVAAHRLEIGLLHRF